MMQKLDGGKDDCGGVQRGLQKVGQTRDEKGCYLIALDSFITHRDIILSDPIKISSLQNTVYQKAHQ